jgi:hypothetical protein
MADSTKMSIAVEAGTESEDLLTPLEPHLEEPDGRCGSFDASVEETRRAWGSSSGDFIARLGVLIRRRLRLAPTGPGAAMVAGLTGTTIRLLTAVLATVLFGEWGGIPWGRWVLVLALYGGVEIIWMFASPPRDVTPPPWVRRTVENWTALLPTIARESDVRDLADYTRRWHRLPATVAAGVVITAIMLLGCVLSVPAALSELPAGTLILLAWLLYGFGTNPIYWGNFFNGAFAAREARYDHRLFWPSPADSPEVQTVVRTSTTQGFATGWWTTVFLVWAVVLVGWDSPLVLPLAVEFVVIGYLSSIGLVISNRASVRKIIERSRRHRLALFRSRIDAFETRMVDLSSEEAEQLRDLLFLHDRIRDAPTSPANAHTAVRTAAGLLIPTIAFVITVFGEVSAERLLDAVLP